MHGSVDVSHDHCYLSGGQSGSEFGHLDSPKNPKVTGNACAWRLPSQRSCPLLRGWRRPTLGCHPDKGMQNTAADHSSCWNTRQVAAAGEEGCGRAADSTHRCLRPLSGLASSPVRPRAPQGSLPFHIVRKCMPLVIEKRLMRVAMSASSNREPCKVFKNTYYQKAGMCFKFFGAKRNKCHFPVTALVRKPE